MFFLSHGFMAIDNTAWALPSPHHLNVWAVVNDNMRIKLESFLLLAFCGAFLLFWELRRGNHHVKVKRSTAKEKPLACSFYAVDEQIKLQMTGKQATEKQERKTQPRTARAETDKENTTITSKDVKLTIVATQSPGKGPEEKPKLTICPSVPPQSGK